MRHGSGWSRRRFLAGTAALGALWLPVGRVASASTSSPSPPPQDFPSFIELYQQVYENWSNEIRVASVWTCAPKTPEDVVVVANWAHANGYTLRAQGFRHNWSPLSVVDEPDAAQQVVLVNTTEHLTGMRIVSSSPAAVWVQTGASMEALLEFLEEAGYGLTATPALGDLSVGGVLAIDGHGTGIPAAGETRIPGHTYGSLSNLIVSLTAVVWDQAQGRYVQRTFDRSAPDCAALLTHLGRAFITEVTLRVGANTNLRCVSRVDIPATELFAAPDSGALRTFASFAEKTGRVEAIWFAFTSRPWLKVWSVSPTKPLTSRLTQTPYNYPFSDNTPESVAVLVGRIVAGAYFLAPVFGQLQYNLTAAGLLATSSADLWGPSKNLLLYIKPSTLPVHTNGYAILTNRGNIQRVVHEFTSFYERLLHSHAERGLFPINGAVEIRVTGLDTPTDVAVAGAQTPALSAIRPREDRPEWNVAVWLNILTIPGTHAANRFYRELEEFVFRNYSGSYAAVRPEWSKGWAYTDQAPWSNPTMLTEIVPSGYRTGSSDDWDWAISRLNTFDPHRIFTNPFLDTLLL